MIVKPGSVGDVMQGLGEARVEDVVLAALPAGLPGDCWAKAFRLAEDPDRSTWVVSPEPDPTIRLSYDQLVASRPLQEELIAWVLNHGRDPSLTRVLESLLRLSTQLIDQSKASATDLFRQLENQLKDSGRFDLVLSFANLTAHACQIVARDAYIVELEAQARTCGISWVYQRTGRLAEAEAELNRSEVLNTQVDCKRGLAFTMKCRGRLRRLLAERSDLSPLASDRLAQLQRSVDDLENARRLFREIGGSIPQIGESISLMARSIFVAGDIERASKLAREAGILLINPWSKSGLDLWLLRCEILWSLTSPEDLRRLEILDDLGKLVDGIGVGYELSEIRARALGLKARLMSDEADSKWEEPFEQALELYSTLELEHSRSELKWWRYVSNDVPDAVGTLLLSETPFVRVHAWESYRSQNEVDSMFQMNRELQGDDLKELLRPHVQAGRAAEAVASGRVF